MAVTHMTASIMPGQSLSTVIDCTADTPKRIRMPNDWQGGGSDVITFQVSYDNIDFYDLYRIDGTEVSAVVKPGTVVSIGTDTGLTGKQYFKVRAGRGGSPIIQAAQRDFVVAVESGG